MSTCTNQGSRPFGRYLFPTLIPLNGNINKVWFVGEQMTTELEEVNKWSDQSAHWLKSQREKKGEPSGTTARSIVICERMNGMKRGEALMTVLNNTISNGMIEYHGADLDTLMSNLVVDRKNFGR